MEENKDQMEVCDNGAEPKSDAETGHSIVFKKPQIGLVGPKKPKNLSSRAIQSDKAADTKSTLTEKEEPSTETTETESNISTSEEKVKKESPVIRAKSHKESDIPYSEPKWAGSTNKPYVLEVVKSGIVVESINLTDKSYIVFGRQTNCHVKMAHPTVSRYHAVLQYSQGTADKPAGFYIFDLGSTHGTFLNKSRIRPELYVRFQVGHQLKLGCSSRLHILQGPEDDMETESEFTVTELKAMRQEELQQRQLAELERKEREEKEKERLENQGIDWGMGDDADEETDLSENPYATTTNEDLYIDDPKKTLRGWFEREGAELEYDVEEKGPGQFLCRVDIPVEGARGGTMVAEAFVKGKKKEAVVQCALEACRILDRLGLLRQSTHESRKRKTKNWEEDDFYDSDDDTFLDRTGAVERKRQNRMQQAGKLESQVETYASLSEKHSAVLKQLSEIEEKLQEATANLTAARLKNAEGDGDSLDSFMSNLNTVGSADKKFVSKLKMDLAQLQKEEVQLRKLVNIARPASLPALDAPASKSSSIDDKEAVRNRILQNMRKKTSNKPMQRPQTNLDLGKKRVESDRKESTSLIPKEKEKIELPPESRSAVPEESLVIENTNQDRIGASESTAKNPPDVKSKSPAPCETKVTPKSDEENSEEETEEQKATKDLERRKKRNRRKLVHRAEKARLKVQSDYDSSDPNYSTWVPPQGQTGDGRTSLNEKLGY